MEILKKAFTFLFPISHFAVIMGLAPFDEIMFLLLICFSFIFLKTFPVPRFDGISLFLIVGLLVSLQGFLLWDPKGIRVFVLMAGSLICIYFFKEIFFENINYLFAGILLCLLIQISITGVNVYRDFYISDWDWQMKTWVGTAYGAYVFYILITLYLIHPEFKKNNVHKFLAIPLIILFYFTTVGMDSRLGNFGAMILLPIAFMKIVSGESQKKISKTLIGTFLLVSITAFSLLVVFSGVGIPSIVNEETGDFADLDRLSYLIATYNYIQDYGFYSLLPQGLYSHQYILSDYISYGSTSSSKIRPTGIPALVVDFGLLIIFALIVWAIKCCIKILKNNLRRTDKVLLLSLLPFTLVGIFATNIEECALFYISLILIEHCSSKDISLNKASF